MKKIAIIGAGPAGLTAAHQLCISGYDVELFDSDNTVGGMSKTLAMWGQLLDLGPHRFFSNDPRANQKLNIYQAFPALTIPLASISIRKNKLIYSNFKNKNNFKKVSMSSADYNNYLNKNKIIKLSNILGNFFKKTLNIKSLKIGKIYFHTRHYLDLLFSNRQHKIILNKFKF